MLTAALRSLLTKGTLRSTLVRPYIARRMSLMEPKIGARIRWCCLRLTWFPSRRWRLPRPRFSTARRYHADSSATPAPNAAIAVGHRVTLTQKDGAHDQLSTVNAS